MYQTFEDTWAFLEKETTKGDSAFREFNNFRALHEAAWVDLQESIQRHTELKRKADDAHERTLSNWERFRRATKDHMTAEEALNNFLGCLWCSTHAREACAAQR